MGYSKPAGEARAWKWDCPAIYQRGAASGSFIDLADMPVGTFQDLIGTDPGQWNNARVTVAVPTTWLDVVFELWVRVGAAFLPLRAATPRGSNPTSTAAGEVASCTLFHVCGWPCDSWHVRARSTGGRLTGAEVSLQVWGTEVCDDENIAANINSGDPLVGPNPLVAQPISSQVLVDRPTLARSAYGMLSPLAAAVRYVQFFDRITVPAAPPPNTNPRFPSIPVQPGGLWSWAPTEGVHFVNGFTIGLSTTWDIWTPSADTMTATLFFDP